MLKSLKFHSIDRRMNYLNDNKPDAVIVATPNQFHEKHTIRFLNAKIPVLLEKPISDDISKAKKIIQAQKKIKLIYLLAITEGTTV